MFVLVSNKWSNFLNGHLGLLRSEGTLCDVTLAGTDGQSHQAHSSVLAAASTVLKSCLVQAPRGHYVVKIPSITSHVWEQLVQFIYEGKVKVSSSEKADLLNAAQTLGLNELQNLLKACPQGESQPGIGNKVVYVQPPISRVEAIFGDDQPSSSGQYDLEAEETKVVDPRLSVVPKEENATQVSTGKSTKYTCTLCGKSFPWGKSLHIHELMHKSKKTARHQCGVCNKMFLSYHSLSAHQRTHSFHPFKCEECNAGFHFQVNYDLHMWKKHQKQTSGELYTCKTCAKTFVAKGLLQRHLSQAHGLKKSKGQMAANKKAVKNESVCICGLCGAKATSKDQMSVHFMQVHQLEMPVFCEICDHAFESAERVSQHYQVHMKKDLDKTEETAAAVEALKEQTVAEQGPFKCELCRVECKSVRLLAKHRRTHEGQVSEDLWRCPVCSMDFDNKPDFTMHIAEHRGEKTFVCKYCNKGFTHKGNYSTHVQRHLGIKPFTCKFCPKSFVRKDDMKSHMRVHTGEKPYCCQVCHVKFSCISNLREHERAKHNISFSKRNPNITVPRQHRPKVKYRSKNVALFDISQASDDLVQMGVIPEKASSSSTADEANLQVPEDLSVPHPTTTGEHVENQEQYYQVIEGPDGVQTLAPVVRFDQKNPAAVTFAMADSSLGKAEDVGAGVPVLFQDGQGVIMSEGAGIMSDRARIMSEGAGIMRDGQRIISEGTKMVVDGTGAVISDNAQIIGEVPPVISDPSAVISDEAAMKVGGASGIVHGMVIEGAGPEEMIDSQMDSSNSSMEDVLENESETKDIL